MKIAALVGITVLLLIQFSTIVLADTEEPITFGDDFAIFGLELEKLLNFGSGIVALIIAVVTALAYKKSKSKKLVYVTVAFSLFAIKGFLTSTELFFGEVPFQDPIASTLNFILILVFFFGIVKK